MNIAVNLASQQQLANQSTPWKGAGFLTIVVRLALELHIYWGGDG